ncbi:MAG: carbohydrate kinase family protein [Micromonosporaceae bacterium]
MIIVVGEALLDLVADDDRTRFTAHPGGSPANVAVGLSRLDLPVTLATQLSDDIAGRLVHDHLTRSGVRIDVLAGTAEGARTSLALAAVDSYGVATYDFRIAWDIATVPGLDPLCVCLHTGSIAAALAPGAGLLDELLATRPGVTVSYDPNIRPSLLGAPEAERVRVESQVGLSDVVKVSSEDLAWLYPGELVTAVAARWLATGPALVVVTLGPDGAYAVNRVAEVRRPALSVTVADTVGAGDAFTAGLLDGLYRADLLGKSNRDRLSGMDQKALADLLDLASRVAGLTCARPGADPPNRSVLDSAPVDPPEPRPVEVL